MELDMRDNDVVWHSGAINRSRWERRNGHKSAIVWFTGLSGSGKSTLACAVEERLHGSGYRTCILDGDNLRHGLCADLGFSDEARHENIRRAGEVAKLFVDVGIIVLAAFISPFEQDRQQVRALVPAGGFFEIYCKCPIEVCEQRDVKGLFWRARRGQVRHFTGISAPYEEPVAPALTLHTDLHGIHESAESVIAMLHASGVLRLPQQQTA
jgi:adenylylsulfate kinase